MIFLYLLLATFSNTAFSQCTDANGNDRESFVNIAIWPNENVFSSGNEQAVRDQINTQVDAVVTRMNAIFASKKLTFRVVFFPSLSNNGTAPEPSTPSLSAQWYHREIFDKFHEIWPCLSPDLIFVPKSLTATPGGEAPGIVARIGLGNQGDIAHEFGHVIELEHLIPGTPCGAHCSMGPTFMCLTAGSDISLTYCDRGTIDRVMSRVETNSPCQRWADEAPIVSATYTCPPTPSVTISTDKRYIHTSCSLDKPNYRVTVNGGTNGATGVFVRPRFIAKDFKINLTTQGGDFNKVVSTSGSTVFNYLNIVDAQGNEISFDLLPNEQKVFQFQLSFQPDVPVNSSTLGKETKVFIANINNVVVAEGKANHIPYQTITGTVNSLVPDVPYFIQGGVSFPNMTLNTPSLVISPGGQITVPAYGSLFSSSDYRTEIQGCDAMWKGIVSRTGTTINLENVKIADAQTAISFERGGNQLNLQNVLFENNNMNIATSPTGSGSTYELSLTDSEVLFKKFKPFYTGQSPLPTQKAHSGVILTNVNNPVQISNVYFDNLKFGTILTNSQANLHNNKYINIGGAASVYGYPGPSESGQGVYAENSQVDVTNSIFTNVNKAINYNLSSGSILHNIIQAGNTGITTSDKWGSTALTDIDDNKVSCALLGISAKVGKHNITNNAVTIDGNNSDAIGIQAGTWSRGSDVSLNTVTMRSGKTAIYAPYVTGQNVLKNTVELHQAAQIGIHKESGAGGLMECNHINGIGTDGVYIIHSSTPNMICNTVTRTNEGFHIEGVSMGGSSIGSPSFSGAQVKGNVFETTLDLHLGESSAIGRQYHHGNLFKGGEVWNESPFASFSSPFFVDPSQNPKYLPTQIAPLGWFIPENYKDETYSCNGGSSSGFVCGDADGGKTEEGETERVAKKELVDGRYATAGNWLAERRLAQYILKEGNPFPDNRVLQDFEASLAEGGLANFALVQNEIDLLGEEIDPEKVNQLLALNEDLLAFRSFEINEKAVNSIFLSTVALNRVSALSDYKETLEDIANRCPLSDGEAVLKARALLGLSTDEPLFWDDKNLCTEGERTDRSALSADGKKHFISLFPNPASNTMTLEYALEGNTASPFQVYNSVGVLVYETKLNNSQGRLSLDVSDWSEGTYWYYLPETARALATGTFVIHR